MIKDVLKKVITAFITISMLFSSILNSISVNAKSSENVDAFTYQVINTGNVQIKKIQLTNQDDTTVSPIEASVEEGNDYADFKDLNEGNYDVKFLDENDSVILNQDNSEITTQINIDSNNKSQTYVYDFLNKNGDFKKLKQTVSFTNDNINESKMTAIYGQEEHIVFKAKTTGKDPANISDDKKIKISYSIKGESEDTQKIATINAESGEVTINGAGTVSVVATASETDYYEEDRVECELIINPATMQTIDVKPYDGILGDKTTIDAVTVDGVPDGATIEYSEDNGSTYSETIPQLTQVGTKKTINVKISKPNYETVTRTVVAYLRKEADISFENIEDGQLEKSFEDEDFNLSIIGVDKDIPGSFSLEDENNGVLTVDSTGKVSIVSDGSAIINYTIDKNDDKCTTAKTISVEVTVKVPNENKLITVNSIDDGNIYTDINENDKKITYYTNTGFILNTTNDYEFVNENENENTITSDIEDYKLSLKKNGKTVKEKSIAKFIENVDNDYTVDFVIDKQFPTLDNIEFTDNKNFIDRMFQFFGLYYDKPVTCTLNNISDNNGSGIKSVSLLDENGNELVDEDGNKCKIDISEETEVDFTLPVGFKGTIYYQIVDNVGNSQPILISNENSNLLKESKEIMIEKDKPIISNTEIDQVDNKWFKYNSNNEVEINDIDFNCSDNGSGIYSVEVKVNDNDIINERDAFKNEKIKEKDYKITKALLKEKNVIYPKDGVLNFEIIVVDNAGNSEHKIFKIYLDKDVPSVLFAIDKNSVKNVDYDEGYGYFFKEDTKVTITASDNEPSSGVKSITYWTEADAGENIDKTEQKVDKNNQVSFTVKAGFKGQIYAYATDKVGWDNTKENAHPDGIVIENGTGDSQHSQHSKATITYNTKEKSMDGDGKHKLFNENVKLTLYVEDTFSGLSEITYSINSDKETIQIPNIRNNPVVNNEINGWKVVETDKNLVTKMSKDIVVDANKYNLNDIQVKIEAKDHVANQISTSEVFSIDKTVPTVSVTYSPETGDTSFNDYYKTNRTATIVVKERNFDKDAFIAYVSKDEKKSKLNLNWTDNLSETGYTDDLTYTATYTYDSDADYIFSIDSITDLATNKAATYQDDVFTIDKTKPVVHVAYDNNSFLNGNYYNKTRIATITITEHNFETSRINIMGTATDNGATVSFPSISGWSTHGDEHSATIVYDKDALYSFDIDYTDKAGNQIDDFTQEEFYVDMTAPTLDITNVADHSANAKEVKPIVSYSDTNFDANAVTISMVGANKGRIELDGVKSQQENGEVFSFNNPAVKKENDDMYTINASVTDKAGNETTKSITYSVNRFGSVYTLENDVKEYNGKYSNKEFDVVIVETNVDTLHNMKVSVSKNNTTNEINQYEVAERNTNGSWKQYQYTINKDLFKNDGRYSVLLYSEDSAGNINENIDEAKESSVNFGIDKTKPSVVAINVENGVTYGESSLKGSFSISDNLVLDNVDIKLNGKKVKYNSDEDVYSFTIPDSTSSQNILVSAKDAAGNVTELEISNFYVTTNLFVRWFNNKPLFIGSVVGVIIIIGGVYWFFIAKRKNESEQEQE